MKRDLSDHFAIFMTCGRSERFFKNTKYTIHAQVIYKRIFSEKQIEQLKLKLHEFNWTEILPIKHTMIS